MRVVQGALVDAQAQKVRQQNMQASFFGQVPAESKVSFIRSLSDAARSESKEKLEALLVQIDEQGRVLSKNPNYRELMLYKKSVKQFLSLVIEDVYGIRYDTGSDRGYRHKSYMLIERVNDRLEELANEILTSEAEPMSIIDKVGEIRGLLLDIVG